MDFNKYTKIKDKYCLCYFGHADEYLLQLRLLKPIFEKRFPGLQLYFGCRDDKTWVFQTNDSFVRLSEMSSHKESFAHVRELRFNGKVHPVWELLIEAGINYCPVGGLLQQEHTDLCVIVTKGIYPTKPLLTRQIDELQRIAVKDGYTVVIDGPVDQAGLVMGAESFALFSAAARGVRTQLQPTGLGTELYKAMFPDGIVR